MAQPQLSKKQRLLCSGKA